MKNKWARLIATLPVLLILALSITAWAARESADLNRKCSLTVKAGGFDDLKNADVVIDLYRIADAKAEDGSDTYAYTVTDPAYKPLESSLKDFGSLKNADNRALAQKAADIVLNQGLSLEKAAESPAGSKITDLESGLYLLIARGNDIDDYITVNGSGEIITIADTQAYTYSYLPELISLPASTAE